jgi:hydroxyacid-oxoacid transhydrogenase
VNSFHIYEILQVVYYVRNRYTERTPRPSNPILRPAYQGSNPVADIFSLWALRTTVEHLPRVAKNPDDIEARKQMLYAFQISRCRDGLH